MSPPSRRPAPDDAVLARASLALAVMAVAPAAVGGVRLTGPAGPSRDAWLAALQAARDADAPWQRLPLHAADDALDGGWDLVGTLAAGRPVHRQGLLAASRGGYLVVQMAERLSRARAARLAQALDGDDRPALVVLDEAHPDDPPLADALADRLALHLRPPDGAPSLDPRALRDARDTWAAVAVSPAQLEALVQAAAALGLASVRAPLQAATVARVVAALRGATVADDTDIASAAQLVLAPRARQLPAPAEADEDEDASADADDDTAAESPPEAADATPPPGDAPPAPAPDDANPPDATSDEPLTVPDEAIVAAALAAIPPNLLAQLSAAAAAAPRRPDAGRAGPSAAAAQRGRPVGSRSGVPRGGARLALVDTLRAAAPWQPLRRRLAEAAGRADAAARVIVHRDDLRVQRHQQRAGTTTVFAIDASGSQALHRLAETKGAVERLLTDCYARRDRVAVIGFRGRSAQLLLPPTRSLVMARRRLAGLPGGGGTPLASGIDTATELALSLQRQGSVPLLVLLTDGKANIDRRGEPGRAAAMADAEAAARGWAALALPALVIDTSPQPGPAAASLASALRGRLLALPYAGAQQVSDVVRAERGTAGPVGARRAR
jgi:magnesium chelatase subunit D